MRKIIKRSLLSISLAIILVITTGSSLVFADFAGEVGVAVTDGFSEGYYDDACEFAEIIDDNVYNWSIEFESYDPDETWYQEEDSGGIDYNYADDAELILLIAHGITANTPTGINFESNGSLDDPDTVRLGYESEDPYQGECLWFYSITCQLLDDSSYSYWLDSLEGMHMMLSFKSNASFHNADCERTAHRLTGTGGYSQESMSSAFISVFINLDATHQYNIARVIAEDSDVFDDDYIDDYDKYITVNSTKHVYTISL